MDEEEQVYRQAQCAVTTRGRGRRFGFRRLGRQAQFAAQIPPHPAGSSLISSYRNGPKSAANPPKIAS
jgi:hypothetical protein